ncbi:MAG: MBL fold metallo-hydrolase [Dehalococcoidia bacterium]|nr:MBL fold metallo-hydrolase [Dehalococcoidia bacterium]
MTSHIFNPYIHSEMKVGDVELSLVSDGAIRVDGGLMYGAVPKVTWKTLSPADSKNRVLLGLNCLLIRSGDKIILVDTGAGSKHTSHNKTVFAMKTGELINGLKAHGLGVEDINLVALTHLHFDHVGGCTRRSYGGEPVPTFPNATYLVQRQDWEEATHPSERAIGAYMTEDFLPLEESRQLELLDGDTEIASGVWLRVTGGHTRGHQIVTIESGDRKVACLGDVLPTAHHLPLHYIGAGDIHPADTLECKRRLLGQAVKERWLLLLSHGHRLRAGYPVQKDGHVTLEPHEL